MQQITQAFSNGWQDVQNVVIHHPIITAVALSATAGFGGAYMLWSLGASLPNAMIGGAVFAHANALVAIFSGLL